MTLPRAKFRPHERLNHPADFRRAFERRRSASDGFLVVYAAENGLDFSRLGLSVAKKKIRKAHDRNHFKRLVREAFRLSKAEVPIGVDFVVVPRGLVLSFDDAIRSFPRLARDAARRLPRSESRRPS